MTKREQDSPDGTVRGGVVIDPTKNVIETVAREVRRLDDLRVASDILTAERHAHLAEMAGLRAEHQQQLAAKETSRLDAIRQFDQINVTAKAEATLTAVQTLAASQSAVASGLNERVAAVEKSIYEGKGRGGGMQQFFGWIVAGLMSALALWNAFGGKHP